MSSNSTVIHPSSSPTSVPHGPWWGDLTQAKESSYQMSLAVWKKLAQPLRTSTSSFRNIIASLPLCCCCCVTSVVSDSAWPHRQQPTRLPWPWDSRGKNTGVGCHFLLQCMKVESESESESEVVSDSPRPYGLQPTRLLCPRDFPGKSAGVGCHRLLPLPLWL